MTTWPFGLTRYKYDVIVMHSQHGCPAHFIVFISNFTDIVSVERTRFIEKSFLSAFPSIGDNLISLYVYDIQIN